MVTGGGGSASSGAAERGDRARFVEDPTLFGLRFALTGISADHKQQTIRFCHHALIAESVLTRMGGSWYRTICDRGSSAEANHSVGSVY